MSDPSFVAGTVCAGVAVVMVMATTAVITKVSGKAAYVDVAWGASFVVATWAVIASVIACGEVPSCRASLLATLVTLWGLRLSWHLGRRVAAAEHDDPRYEHLLGGPIAEVPFLRVVGKVFVLQAVLVIAVCVPLVLGIVDVDPSGATATVWWVVVGALLWLTGVFFETVSDAQLAAYRADPHRPRILATGLWAWSRHPNYFGDFCVWWGLWMIGGAAGGFRDGVLSVWSPLLMSWILIGISGVRLAERRMAGRPGWAAYRARTPIFLPRPPVRKKPIQ